MGLDYWKFTFFWFTLKRKLELMNLLKLYSDFPPQPPFFNRIRKWMKNLLQNSIFKLVWHFYWTYKLAITCRSRYWKLNTSLFLKFSIKCTFLPLFHTSVLILESFCYQSSHKDVNKYQIEIFFSFQIFEKPVHVHNSVFVEWVNNVPVRQLTTAFSTMMNSLQSVLGYLQDLSNNLQQQLNLMMSASQGKTIDKSQHRQEGGKGGPSPLLGYWN